MPDFTSHRIFALTPDGEGLSTHEDHDIGIPFALPGEIVKARSYRGLRKKWRYEIQEITRASSHRKAPVCAHFTQCGGCTLQHMDDCLYREFKTSLITQALLAHNLDPFVCEATRSIPFGQRRRANLEAVKKGDTLFFGFHRWKSHQIIDLSMCPALDDELQRFIFALKETLFNVLNDRNRAQIFILNSAVGLDIALEIQDVVALDPSQRDALKALAKSKDVARLFFRHRKKRDVLYHARDPVVDIDGLPVQVDAYSFLQASTLSDRLLAELVCEMASHANGRIADLFCGRGTFTLPLSRLASVDGFESDQVALNALEKAAVLGERPITTYCRDLFQNPLMDEEIKRYDVVVMDPPRAGAENQMRHLVDSRVSRIVYVSCSHETFARDAAIAVRDGGYIIERLVPVDQFAYSAHMELVALLRLA